MKKIFCVFLLSSSVGLSGGETIIADTIDIGDGASIYGDPGGSVHIDSFGGAVILFSNADPGPDGTTGGIFVAGKQVEFVLGTPGSPYEGSMRIRSYSDFFNPDATPPFELQLNSNLRTLSITSVDVSLNGGELRVDGSAVLTEESAIAHLATEFVPANSGNVLLGGDLEVAGSLGVAGGTIEGGGIAAIGVDSEATAANAVAIGSLAESTSVGSVALGTLNRAASFGAVALGYNSYASGPVSFAAGGSNRALGNGATAFGVSNEARSLQTVVGFYNLPEGPVETGGGEADHAIFMVGNGTLSERSNALVVRGDGDTEISGSLTVDGYADLKVLPKGGISMGAFTTE